MLIFGIKRTLSPTSIKLVTNNFWIINNTIWWIFLTGEKIMHFLLMSVSLLRKILGKTVYHIAKVWLDKQENWFTHHWRLRAWLYDLKISNRGSTEARVLQTTKYILNLLAQKSKRDRKIWKILNKGGDLIYESVIITFVSNRNNAWISYN